MRIRLWRVSNAYKFETKFIPKTGFKCNRLNNKFINQSMNRAYGANYRNQNIQNVNFSNFGFVQIKISFEMTRNLCEFRYFLIFSVIQTVTNLSTTLCGVYQEITEFTNRVWQTKCRHDWFCVGVEYEKQLTIFSNLHSSWSFAVTVSTVCWMSSFSSTSAS